MNRYRVGYDIKDIRKPVDLGGIVIWIFVVLIIIGVFILVSSIQGPIYSDVIGGKGV